MPQNFTNSENPMGLDGFEMRYQPFPILAKKRIEYIENHTKRISQRESFLTIPMETLRALASVYISASLEPWFGNDEEPHRIQSSSTVISASCS